MVKARIWSLPRQAGLCISVLYPWEATLMQPDSSESMYPPPMLRHSHSGQHEGLLHAVHWVSSARAVQPSEQVHLADLDILPANRMSFP